MSYSGLRTLFREVMEENVHDYVQRRRLERAQHPLSDPGLSIKQVAEQMNFSSEFYFSHFFKKLKGVSPRNYRDQQRRNRRSLPKPGSRWHSIQCGSICEASISAPLSLILPLPLRPPQFRVRLVVGVPHGGGIGGIEQQPGIHGRHVAIAKELIVALPMPRRVESLSP